MLHVEFYSFECTFLNFSLTNSLTKPAALLNMALFVGAKVHTARCPGIVKFVGETQFSPGSWVGVELRDPVGKTNGTVRGVKYFECAPKHGVFLQPEQVQLQEPQSSSLSNGSTTPSAQPNLKPTGDNVKIADRAGRDPSVSNGSAESPPVLRGFLMKRTKGSGAEPGRWMRAWFVLRTDGTLQKFLTRDDRIPSSSISLQSCRIKRGTVGDAEFGFSIVTESKTWTLAAASQDELNSWIDRVTSFATPAQVSSSSHAAPPTPKFNPRTAPIDKGTALSRHHLEQMYSLAQLLFRRDFYVFGAMVDVADVVDDDVSDRLAVAVVNVLALNNVAVDAMCVAIGRHTLSSDNPPSLSLSTFLQKVLVMFCKVVGRDFLTYVLRPLVEAAADAPHELSLAPNSPPSNVAKISQAVTDVINRFRHFDLIPTQLVVVFARLAAVAKSHVDPNVVCSHAFFSGVVPAVLRSLPDIGLPNPSRSAQDALEFVCGVFGKVGAGEKFTSRTPHLLQLNGLITQAAALAVDSFPTLVALAEEYKRADWAGDTLFGSIDSWDAIRFFLKDHMEEVEMAVPLHADPSSSSIAPSQVSQQLLAELTDALAQAEPRPSSVRANRHVVFAETVQTRSFSNDDGDGDGSDSSLSAEGSDGGSDVDIPLPDDKSASPLVLSPSAALKSPPPTAQPPVISRPDNFNRPPQIAVESPVPKIVSLRAAPKPPPSIPTPDPAAVARAALGGDFDDDGFETPSLISAAALVSKPQPKVVEAQPPPVRPNLSGGVGGLSAAARVVEFGKKPSESDIAEGGADVERAEHGGGVADIEAMNTFVQEMDLSSRRLSSVPPLALFQRLHTLCLDANDITTIENLPPTLRTVCVRRNRLTSMRGLSACPLLEVVKLSSNQVRLQLALPHPRRSASSRAFATSSNCASCISIATSSRPSTTSPI
jgi:hypothetical protein